jgi:acetyltransferase-like isoleucine patch superfamily enzyme
MPLPAYSGMESSELGTILAEDTKGFSPRQRDHKGLSFAEGGRRPKSEPCGDQPQILFAGADLMLFLRLARLFPIAGWLANLLRFPGLKTGLRVEIDNSGVFRYGKAVSIGEGSRIDVAPNSVIEIADSVCVSRSVHLTSVKGLRTQIGARSTVQDGCRIYGEVTIGQRCILAPNIFVSSGTHVFEASPHLPIQVQEGQAAAESKPVRILSDCWLGINTVILRGVTIGRGCVIGANSVVTKDLLPYSVAAGNPAQVIRQRLEFLPKERIDASVEHDDPYFYDGFEITGAVLAGKLTIGEEFTLALRKRDACKIRLNAAGKGATIIYNEHCRTLSSNPGVVEFDLGTQADSLWFIQMRIVGSCRILWAELV